MNCLEIMHELAEAVALKYPNSRPNEIPTNPGHVAFLEKAIGQDEFDNSDIWLGYAVCLAEWLGAINHAQAEEIMNGKPRDIQSAAATDLMTLGTQGRISSLIISIGEGELDVIRNDGESDYALNGISEIVDCLRVAMYLLCTRAPNRPRADTLAA